MPLGLDELAAQVSGFIARQAEIVGLPAARVADDELEFDRLALAAYELQYAGNRSYRAFCDRRGSTPDTVSRWQEIPAVPTVAFKSLDLCCVEPERVFVTSGTTQGKEQRGRHLVARLALYEQSAVAHFRRMVLPDGARPRFIGLLGGPSLLSDSSLTQMVEWLGRDLGTGSVEYLVDADGFDPARAVLAIESASVDLTPLCLIGLRVVFTSLLDYLRSERRSLSLPPDSRLVDTGGAKGGRALSDGGFLAAAWNHLGVAGYYCVGEYGMTELCSQFYDSVLAARFSGSNAFRRKQGPAWTRTVAVDPATLQPVPFGERGILRHIDLANTGSVVAVQTEDLGSLHSDGFELHGRLAGAEPRGCALALQDLLGP